MSRRKHTRKSRQRIYDAAVDEFAEFGLAGARVDRIASRARINKAMIYYHFGSKQSLYDAIIRDIAEATVARVGAVMRHAASLEEVLFAIARYHAEGLAERGKVSRILLHELAAGGESFQRIIPELGTKEGVQAIIIGMIDAGKREGRYRDVDTRHAIISFVGMSIFYLLMAPMINRAWDVTADVEFRNQRPQAIVDLFMEGLKAR